MNPTLLLPLSSLVTFELFEFSSSSSIYLALDWLIPNLSAKATFMQVNKTNQGSFPGPEINWNVFCPYGLIYLSHRVASALHLMDRDPDLSKAIKLAGMLQIQGEWCPSHCMDNCKLVSWPWPAVVWYMEPHLNFLHPEVAQHVQERGKNPHQGSWCPASQALEG